MAYTPAPISFFSTFYENGLPTRKVVCLFILQKFTSVEYSFEVNTYSFFSRLSRFWLPYLYSLSCWSRKNDVPELGGFSHLSKLSLSLSFVFLISTLSH